MPNSKMHNFTEYIFFNRVFHAAVADDEDHCCSPDMGCCALRDGGSTNRIPARSTGSSFS